MRRGQPLAAYQTPAITIIKPLCGADPDLFANLESFFQLDYPVYQIIFCMESRELNKFASLIFPLMARYPHVDTRCAASSETLCQNPKISNAMRAYPHAKHECVLISDSNVCVERNYLREVVSHHTPWTGVVTSPVVGVDARSFGARLEAAYLNTYMLRGIWLMKALGVPFVLGKSMLLRKADLEEFGGLPEIGRFLNEDYKTGVRVREIGMSVEVAAQPVHQVLGKVSFKSYWQRHLRWSRICKAEGWHAFIIDPLTRPVVACSLGAIALSHWNKCPLAFNFLDLLLLWLSCDLFMVSSVAQEFSIIAWLVGELIALPLWIYTACGNSVQWRGKKIRLRRGCEIDNQAPLEVIRAS